MKKLFIIPILLFFLLLGVPSYSADFNKGLTAAQNGDFATALKEWKPLAEQGDAKAQHNLGGMYENGIGVPQDFKEAVRFYWLSAEQGYANSQSMLGFLYENGKGVPQDFIYAHMWWNIAASNGIESARKMLKRIEKKITPSDISEAQRLARECVKKNYKGCWT